MPTSCPSPPINVDCNVLLVADKFSKDNFYFNIDEGKRGRMLKFVSLDVHFDIKESEG